METQSLSGIGGTLWGPGKLLGMKIGYSSLRIFARTVPPLRPAINFNKRPMPDAVAIGATLTSFLATRFGFITLPCGAALAALAWCGLRAFL